MRRTRRASRVLMPRPTSKTVLMPSKATHPVRRKNPRHLRSQSASSKTQSGVPKAKLLQTRASRTTCIAAIKSKASQTWGPSTRRDATKGATWVHWVPRGGLLRLYQGPRVPTNTCFRLLGRSIQMADSIDRGVEIALIIARDFTKLRPLWTFWSLSDASAAADLEDMARITHTLVTILTCPGAHRSQGFQSAQQSIDLDNL